MRARASEREREIERETFPSSIASVDPMLPRVSVVSRQCRFSALLTAKGASGLGETSKPRDSFQTRVIKSRVESRIYP